MRWPAVPAVFLAMASCAEQPPGVDLAEVLGLRWRAGALTCMPTDADALAFVDALDVPVSQLEDEPARAVAQAQTLLALARGPNVRIEVALLGPTDLAVTVGVGCPSTDEPGADLWISAFERQGGTWRSRARKRFAAPLRHELIAVGQRSARVAVLSVGVGTQAAQGELLLLDRDLMVLDRVPDLLDPEANRRGPVSVLHWSRRPRHLDVPWESPLLVREEAVVDLDREPMVLRGASSSPWLDAFDAVCDGPPGAMPCQGELIADQVVEGGRELHIASVPRPLRCAVARDAPPPANVDDRTAVVTMRWAGSAWQVDAVRPGDRRCSVYGARLIPQAARAASGDLIDVPGVPRALAVTADGLIVATSEALFALHSGKAVLLTEVDEPVDVSTIAAGIAFIDDAHRLRRTNAPASRQLAEDPDAVALAGCGDALCWSAYEAGEIRRLRRGTIETLAQGLHHPMGLATTPKGLLVATDDGLLAVDLASGAAVPVGAAVAPLDVAANGDAIAWTEATGRLVVQVGGQTQVVRGGGRPSAVALDGRFVYWIDLEAGVVRRAAVTAP
jgi:hypothetical protein